MKLDKSHKDKIIIGIIGIIILFLTLYIKECFEKRAAKSDSKQSDNSIVFQSSDSSTQNSGQAQQNITGARDVRNENIGTKIVNQYQAPQTNSSNRDANSAPNNITVNNSGNFNAGAVENLLQMVTNPPIRNLNKEQTAEILSSIPEGYTVEIRFPDPDQEADGFSNQIMNLLNGSGRKAYKIRTHDIRVAVEKGFGIEPYPDKPDILILTVYPQK